MNNYFRVTAYNKEHNFTCILDSDGMFEKLWQFSAFLVAKGFSIIDASKLENIKETNIPQVEYNENHLFLRATCNDKIEPTNNIISVGMKYYSI